MKIASINSVYYSQNAKNKAQSFKGSSLGGGKVVYEVVKEGAKSAGVSSGSFLFGALSILGIGMALAKFHEDNIKKDLGEDALYDMVMDRIKWDATLG